MPDVRIAYQFSVFQPQCLSIKGTCLVLKTLELQPEHVQDITDGFTLNLLALVRPGRFMQFCNNTLNVITVNTSHTLHDIVSHCRHHTESPTSNRLVMLHFYSFVPIGI